MSGILSPGRIRSQIVPSYTVQAANDAEKTIGVVGWIKVKEIRVDQWVDVEKYATRIRFEMHGESGWAAHGQVRRNGVNIGTEYWTAAGGYVTYDEDLRVELVDGDLLQLYGYKETMTSGWYRNFEIMGTITQHIRSLDEACVSVNTVV